MRGGLTSRMVVASGLLAVVVAAAFAFLVRAIQAEHNSANRSKLSQQILSSTNELERLVVDLETGQRGFVITGQARFLDPWTAAQSEIPKVSRELNRRTTVTAQGQRARQITAAVASYVADYSVPLVEAARRGEASAGSVDAIDEGKRRVDALRAGFDRLVTTERNFALASQNHSDASARRAIVAASFGLVGSVVLIVLFALYLTGQIVRPVRRAAAMASQFASGDLSVRMPETGPAEIGALEHSFNTMGDSLEASREDLAASRARVVAAADETRRRIERDLHDGTQQRLVSLALELRTAETFVPPGLEHLATQLAHTARGLAAVVEDLQEVSRGIHPAILSKGGLGPALRNLARRSAVPVELDVPADGRL
ncbi:MAG: hypothetical protein QOI55_1712, partial [Actinomycetota bacterium]|nr:hypothetical protein [Actinomycetota bacterium]